MNKEVKKHHARIYKFGLVIPEGCFFRWLFTEERRKIWYGWIKNLVTELHTYLLQKKKKERAW